MEKNGDVTMKVTEKYVINKMNFKKDIWNEGKIEHNLLKYILIKKQPKQMNFEKYINIVLFNKFD